MTEEERKILDETEIAYRAENPESLRVFDGRTSGYRDCTQKDINDLMQVATSYGNMARFWTENHTDLLVKLNPPPQSEIQ